MSLLHIEYLIPVIFFLFLLSIYITSREKNFFEWIEKFWFYKRSRKSKLSSVLFIISISLMMIALLDLRGPEKSIEAKVSKQQTIILIDSSASMLAEDVRPNRFKKAIVLAKHYVKKAVGQHISVTVFSDSQKRIVPFTDDTDLLEARLSGLESLDLSQGGTGLKLALQESVQYFQSKSDDIKGNILVLSDAENNSDYGVVKIDGNINVAVVGVGTVKGAPIPIRDSRGKYRGNKKYKGEEVISKLNESFLKNLNTKISNYKYWTASSYSLPTSEILNFFKGKNNEQDQKDNVRIRPVLANFLLVPAMIFFAFSLFLKNFKTFIIPCLIFTFAASANDKKDIVEKEKVKSEIIKELEMKFKKSGLSEIEKRKLANELLKEKFPKEAASLYREIIKTGINEKNKKDYFNLGASEIENKNNTKGLSVYKDLYEYLKKNDPNSNLFEETKKNMLKALRKQQKQKKQKKKEEQKKKKNNDKKKKGNEGDPKESSKNGKGSDKKDEKENKKDGKSNKKDEKQDKSNKNKDSKDNNKKKNESNNEKQGKNKSASKRKLPAILKQLVNDDNQLQRKVIDAATVKRGDGAKKDW